MILKGKFIALCKSARVLRAFISHSDTVWRQNQAFRLAFSMNTNDVCLEFKHDTRSA